VAPWDYTNKNGQNTFLKNSFFEGGIDLTALGLASGCISSFMAETRSSSTGLSSQLKDFALGNFNLCGASGAGSDHLSKAGDPITLQIRVENTGAIPLYIDDVVDQPPQTGTNFTLGNLVVNGVVQTVAQINSPVDNHVTAISVDINGTLLDTTD